MTPPETTDPNDEPQQPTNDERRHADPATNRPMSVEEIQESYARYADWIDRFSWLDRLFTGRYRRHFANADGGRDGNADGDRRILDVACGSGPNFRYLPASADLVGIDISEAMLAMARTELDRLDRDGRLERMNAHELEFDDDSFETVISSFSTCTFPDPIAALREMERVCRPGGQILLVEHGRSDVELLARYQEWRADAHYEKAGCRVTQEPLEIVRQAGLSVETADSGQFGRITTITCRSRRTDEDGREEP